MGRWEKTLRDGSDIQVQAYYDRTNRYEPNFGEMRDTFDVDFLQRFAFRGGRQVSWGLGARFSHANDLEVVTGLTFVPSRRTDDLLSGFVQDEISLVEKRLSLVVGTKLLHTNFTGFEAEPSARILWTPSDKPDDLGGFYARCTNAVRCGGRFLSLRVHRGKRVERVAAARPVQCQPRFRAGATQRL